MMNCERAKELFSGLYEGSLSEGLADAVRRHLENCGECEADFQEFSALCTSLSALPPVAPPPLLHERIMGDVERALWERQEATRIPMRLRGLRFALALGALVALVLTGLLVYQLLPSQKHQASLFPALPGYSLPAPPIVSYDSEGRLNVEVKAYRDLEIKIFRGGTDFSLLPPKDAELLYQKSVPSGESLTYLAEPPASGEGTALYWMETNLPGRVSLIVVPGKTSTAPSKTRTNLIQGLRFLSERYGVPIDAVIGSPGADLEFDPALPSAEASARWLLKNTPYTVSLQGGILRVR
jgi:anti-sigma factor RsiW